MGVDVEQSFSTSRMTVIAGVLALAGFPATAAPDSMTGIVGSQFNAAKVLAQRPPAVGPCLSADYFVRVTKTDGAVKSEGKRTALLCENFLATTEGGTTIVHDFALNRIFHVFAAGYTNYSTYADAAFRAYEMQNRIYLAQVLSAADKSDGLFRDETALQVPASKSGYLSIENRRDGDDAVDFLFKGRRVARAAYSDYAVPGKLHAVAAKSSYLFFRLHPRIADSVAADGRMPQFIEAETGDPGREKAVFELQSVTATPANFPLQADLSQTPWLSPILSKRPELGSAIRSAAALPLPAPLEFEAFLDRMDQQSAARDHLGVLLTAFEVMYTHEAIVGACDRSSELSRCKRFYAGLRGAVQSKDPRVSAYMKASEAETKDQAAVGLAALDSIKVKNVSNAYVIEVLRALLLIDAIRTKASVKNYPDRAGAVDAAFGGALAGNPYMTTVLNDAGNWRYSQYETYDAWEFFDLGRSMPHFTSGLLDEVTSFERATPPRFPFLFLSIESD